jgi:hypothetical protein
MISSEENKVSLVSGAGKGPFWTNVPLLALIAANTIPLIGVLFLKWDVFYIVFFYWAENLAVGFYNVLKMAFVKVKHPAENLGKLFMIPFFLVHYGGFTAGHGFFIFHFFGEEHVVNSMHHRETWPCFFVFLQMLINLLKDVFSSVSPTVRLAILSLFISHGISFVYNYLLKGEYKRINPATLMGQPYVRIFVMHITVLFGGILLQVTGSPAAFLIILVALKTGIDIKLHKLEHKKAANRK